MSLQKFNTLNFKQRLTFSCAGKITFEVKQCSSNMQSKKCNDFSRAQHGNWMKSCWSLPEAFVTSRRPLTTPCVLPYPISRNQMESDTLVASVSLQFLSIGTRVNIFITSYYTFVREWCLVLQQAVIIWRQSLTAPLHWEDREVDMRI